MKRTIALAALTLLCAAATKAQTKYDYSVDIANIKDDKVAVTLVTPAVTEDVVTFSFPKAIPGSYARKDFGRFIEGLAAFDKDGKKMPIQKLNDNQFKISGAKQLSKISYLVNDTWDKKHSDFIFQPGGSNIEAGQNVVMNNHAFYGYFEGMSMLPYKITVTKPEAFYASTHLDVKHPSADKDVIEAKDYVYLADNPIIYAKPDTTSFYAGKTKINVFVYSASGKVKSEQVANYLKPITFALEKFFNGLPVSSYQFLYYFEEPKKGLTDRDKGEGGFGALEHNYSSLYYLPEREYENSLISMINDVSTHEFLHIQTPLNLHSFEIANFNFSAPEMSRHLWLYEGITEYFAQLVQLQTGLMDEKKFFKAIRTKINRAQPFGDFSMTEMSKRVLEDKWQKKYETVYTRGALLGLLLDIFIRDKTQGKKDLKSVIKDLSAKYGPDRPFEDDKLVDEFVAASHPDVKLFIDQNIEGKGALPYTEMFDKIGYDYATSKDLDVYYPGKMGLKYDKPTNTFQFASVEKNALDIKENDIFVEMDGIAITPDNVDDVWDAYFSENLDRPNITVKIIRDGKEKILKGDLYAAKLTQKNSLRPVANKTEAQEQFLKALKGIK